MNTNQKIHLFENAIEGGSGLLWNRLHSEREDICEALIKDSRMGFGADLRANGTVKVATKNRHDQVLHERLQRIDDALDRIMSGSYGHCIECHRDIEPGTLDFDPALALCRECRAQSHSKALPCQQLSTAENSNSNLLPTENEVVFEELRAFDTILVRTRNTDYRILLLDPGSGRALVEGGQFFVEPVEAWLSGSTLHDSPFKLGSVAVGYHLEMWVDDQVVRTSLVQSIGVEHPEAADSSEPIAETVH